MTRPGHYYHFFRHLQRCMTPSHRHLATYSGSSSIRCSRDVTQSILTKAVKVLLLPEPVETAGTIKLPMLWGHRRECESIEVAANSCQELRER